jgi:Flp pilus assembly protein TadG
MKFRRVRRLWKDEEGSPLVEGAIVVPFLFALVLGTLEFSYYFYQQHMVSMGLRDAARYLARTPDPTAAQFQTIARNLAATGDPNGGSLRRVTGFDPEDVSIVIATLSNSGGAYREAKIVCGGPTALRMISVTGSYTYPTLGVWGFLGFAVPMVSVTHTERCIGPG